MAKTKTDPKENYLVCVRCKNKVPRIDPINVSMLTAKASYWREMPNKINICPDCSKELSDVVDSWWYKVAEPKYKINKEEN